MRYVLLFVAATAVITSWPLFGEEHDWKIGRVLDSRIAKSSTPVGAVTSPGRTAITFANIRDNELAIVSSEFGYVIEDTRITGGGSPGEAIGHAIANRHHGCHFIIGDDVRFWQQRAELHIVDADGKECKVDVLRQERLAPNFNLTPTWKSVMAAERFQVRTEGDFIYAESIGSGKLDTPGLSAKIDASKSGNLYVGKKHFTGHHAGLKSATCVFDEEIEFNLVTPTRIEGTIFAPLPGAKFDWKTCQYLEPNRIQKFAWIPE